MKKIIYLALLLIFVSSCENNDFFDLERPVESPWLSLYEFERAPIGSYRQLFSTNLSWGNGYNYWYLYKNAVADDVAWATPGDAAWGWYRDTENNKSWLNSLFQNCYQVIASVNDALQFVEENNGNPYPKITEEDKVNNLDRIVGELYFLRGFAYYTLATTFCDAYVPGGDNSSPQIPLRTTKASSYEEASNSEIGTTEEIWMQILADFQKAYEILPERYIEGLMHISYQAGRANKFAAAAMVARSYFAMGDYENTENYVSFVIEQNGGDFNLNEEPIEAFNKSTLARGMETIMYTPCYDETTGNQNLHAGCFSHMLRSAPCPFVATHMDYSTLQRLGWMEAPKSDTTITIIAKRDKRFQQLMAIREAANIPEEKRDDDKYYETRTNLEWRTILANKYFRGPGEEHTNVPTIRLAEMYLTRAICLFKMGDKQGAADDLNMIRKRAWDETVAGESYESSDSYVTSGNITEQMINDERLIEMFMEGDRIDYLRGLKIDVGNGERGDGSVPYTDKGFVWSIPIQEEELNQAYN
ncbi:RagB/SusD family nutrient uptake outer membrane protein [Maribellus maritimus]|uniref:RagB/SusD family nutrient uptake outer membrane protein n=1 Tax=Maribellus maritimus TaxID=2870838 RepID=UPI001EEC4449|nr:RagB/SusD family nutrient uptake outer membrane protein [Maribellus maritimus]MCG6190142.1 RagB/SusD family nutrient uptake outer membrane protein [Maribellus maritimus]